jgi:MarR family transcriptional regulator, lower aerobic nicotinate degradation pathway regulator
MEKFDLVKQLILEVEEYENQMGSKMDMAGFSQYLVAKNNPPKSAQKVEGRAIESLISQLVVSMNKYAKLYFKVILENAPIQNSDEVIFVMILLVEGKMTKTELFQKAIQEKTTAMEIMKRLEKIGFIHSFDNPNDKRSKMVEITPHGILFMQETFPKLDILSNIVCGGLNQKEKETLLQLLSKLDDFHKPIYQQNKQKEALLGV